MSEFLKLLDEVGGNSHAPMGFGVAAQKERPAALVCVGILRKPHPKLQALIREGGLTALLAVCDDAGLVQEADDVPWGMWPTSVAPDTVARCKEKGCDFLVGSPESVQVAALEDEEMAFFLALPPDLDDRLLRTLEELPVDGVLLTCRDLGPPLTLQHLMTIGAVRTMFGRHLLVVTSPDLRKGDLEHLRDLGVVGIAVELEGLSPESLGELRHSIASVAPERRARHRERGELIPYVPRYRAAPVEQEEDEEVESEF